VTERSRNFRMVQVDAERCVSATRTCLL
jgi:hypothetical protein